MLAKNARAPRSIRMSALSLTFFASKLAPTVETPTAIKPRFPPWTSPTATSSTTSPSPSHG
ncbi:hypothetical protein C1Y23_14570 [Pseudomonas sp. GW460-12]|nr:hypothetical protein C1Y23_14570 [Pseudomonas sp. GW460-12]PMX36535.1 hypothetical protein C1Y24_05705 [Pseudomonas sp. MPR-R2A4]PMX54144.1 hypothetical protein C1Y17_09755 [Pseudomonas sp. MPR-R2A6]PMX91813.1 hypothetical protein C1Y21_09645 [Pseudomonas sp. MPR-R2A3]PMY15325.1 hypothetical protein C1Y22_06250 [Pseudomonas sp. MPR-R2A5]PNA35309.1 hypothetical protein C1Y16_09070 [Pseudomonas sp. MPR-ANB1]PNA50609.1 hypothetical protein C1Y15_03740 [Pseudomonas sp. MPR-LB5]PNA78977.1 hypo